MKKLILLILLITPLVLVINSCKPGENNPKPGQTNFPVPQEVKDYMYFKPGTYWIYQDSISGALDTVKVTDTLVSSQTKNGMYYEHYQTNTYSSYDKYFYYYKVNTSFSDDCINNNENRPCYNILCVKTKPGNYIGELAVLFMPFWKSYSGNQYISPGEYSGILIEDQINNLPTQIGDFKDVILIKSTNNILFDKDDIRLFFSRKAGIVRKEYLNKNQIWKLIQFNIIQ